MGVISVGVEMPERIGDIEVISVITGTEAMAKLAHAACDAVVVGPRVPDMPVSAIVDEFVRRYPRVPVILVADAPRPGVWEHVPFSDERLHAAIARAVEVGLLRRLAAESRDTLPVAPSASPRDGDQLERTFRKGTIREMERLMIFARLDRLDQNRTRSAASLDISVRTLRNKLREYREAGLLGAAAAEER
jgi:DNA-binding NtrC family response regulator